MTPAINTAKKAKISFQVHEYAHNPATPSYGQEAADALGQPPQRVFKTMLVALNGDGRRLAVAIVPVSGSLDLKALAAALGAKKVTMADATDAERVTGYVVGGISPLGQKKRLPTVLDVQALEYPSIYMSAGRRGLEIEMAAADLITLTAATTASIGRG